MARFLTNRLLQTLVLCFVVSVVVLLLLHSSGDPVALLLPEEATPEMVVDMRARLGLDRSLVEQYVMFLNHAAAGELRSYRFRQPAFSMVLEYFQRSLYLVVSSMALALLLALPIGALAAVRRGTMVDHLVQTFAYLGQALPLFLLAMLLIQLMSVTLGLLPVSGTGTVRHWVLPVATLVLFNLAVLVRMTRSSMLNVLTEDYVRTAWAKGLAPRRVIGAHALRTAAIGIVSLFGVRVAELLGGILIVEVVFSWPGLGWLFYTAVTQRDYPLVLAGTVVTTLAVGLCNLLVDIANGILDPRIRYA